MHTVEVRKPEIPRTVIQALPSASPMDVYLSSLALLAKRHHHTVIAAFVFALLAVAGLANDRPVAAILCGFGYVCYMAWRSTLSPRDVASWWYSPSVTVVRIGLSLIGITATIIFTESQHSAIFILYGLIIWMAVRHLVWPTYLFVAIISVVFLTFTHLWELCTGYAYRLCIPASNSWATYIDFISQCLTLGLISYIIHFLLREIQVREITISGYREVNTLATKINQGWAKDRNEGRSPRPSSSDSDTRSSVNGTDAIWNWQPVLETILICLPVREALIYFPDHMTLRLRAHAQFGWVSDNPPEGLFVFDRAQLPDMPLNADATPAQALRSKRYAPRVTGPANSLPQLISQWLEGTLMARWIRPNLNSPTLEADISFPLMVGPDVLGVLQLHFKSGYFQPDLINEMLDFIRTLEDLTRPMLVYQQRLDTLNTQQIIAKIVRDSLDIDRVVKATCDVIVDHLGFDLATISLVDKRREEIRCVGGRNVSIEWQQQACHSLISKDIQAWVVKNELDDEIDGDDPRLDKAIYNEFGHADLVRIFLPVFTYDKVLQRQVVTGTIEAGVRRSRQAKIRDAQKQVLKDLSKHVAIALQHAQLAQREHQHSLSLMKLHHISRQFSGAEDAATLTNLIGPSARDLLGADLALFYEFDRERLAFLAPVIFGKPISGRATFELTLQRSRFMNDLFQLRRAYYAANACNDPLPFSRPSPAEQADVEDMAAIPFVDLPQPLDITSVRHDLRIRRTFVNMQGIRSFAALPLIADGERLGILVINYRQPQQFDEGNQYLHELFAQHLASAFKNLHNRDQARVAIVHQERNRLSRDLHDMVKRELNDIMLVAVNLRKHMHAYTNSMAALPLAGVMARCEGWAVETPLTVGREVSTRQLIERLDTGLRVMQGLAYRANDAAGFIVNELRAPDDELTHLVAGLEQYVARVRRWLGCSISYCHIGQSHFPEEIQHTVARIAREAINNAVKYGQAKHISVETCWATQPLTHRLQHERQILEQRLCNGEVDSISVMQTGELSLKVGDDGVGFIRENVSPDRMGLRTIQELAQHIGATLLINSQPKTGTQITLSVALSFCSTLTRDDIDPPKSEGEIL